MNDASAFDAAPQHGPRPLPLFLEIVRSETAASPDLQRQVLAGLSRYQAAPRNGHRPPPPSATHGRACLRAYGGDGPPLVVVPSLINPPLVLDLAPANSLMHWLATQGVRPLLVDWGTPEPTDRAMTLADHVEHLLVPLLDTLGEVPLLAGYCLGGTLAIAAAMLRPPRALALIATPWHFGGFPDASRRAVGDIWDRAQPACDALGLVPMEVLQAGFWRLDPARVAQKYADYAVMPSGAAADAFVTLEDWANGGAPLTYAAGRELLRALFVDDLTGSGHWQVAGRPVDPARLECPVLDFVSASDRIVPAASATGLPDRRILSAGHVGMMVGRGAPAQLWEPLAAFLRAH